MQVLQLRLFPCAPAADATAVSTVRPPDCSRIPNRRCPRPTPCDSLSKSRSTYGGSGNFGGRPLYSVLGRLRKVYPLRSLAPLDGSGIGPDLTRFPPLGMSPPSSDGLAPFPSLSAAGPFARPPSETFEPSAPRRQLSGGSSHQPVRGTPWVFRRVDFVDFPTFSNAARSASRRAANQVKKKT